MKKIIVLILLCALTGFAQKKPGKAVNFLITTNSVGKIKIGMTVAEARKAAKGFTFNRDWGSEGSVVISVKEGKKEVLTISADEGYEPDPNGKAPPINEKAKITSIEVLDPRYVTEKGVRVGTGVELVEKKYGRLKEIFWDQHVGEIADFTDLPKTLSILLIGKGRKYGEAGDYVGAEPQDYGQRTKKYKPGAMVSRISVFEYVKEPVFIAKSVKDALKDFDIEISGPSDCTGDSSETMYFIKPKEEGIQQSFSFNDLLPCIDEGDEQSETRLVAYADQFDVSVGDFDFDGYEDVALRDGMNGGYGSASYQVYLFSKTEKQFVHNSEFTKLAQLQGMFQINKEKKMLFVYSKSGCCFHKTEGYQVIDNNPVKVYEKTEDSADAGNPKIVIKELINGKWITKTEP